MYLEAKLKNDKNPALLLLDGEQDRIEATPRNPDTHLVPYTPKPLKPQL
jgi:hypothetical protein